MSHLKKFNTKPISITVISMFLTVLLLGCASTVGSSTSSSKMKPYKQLVVLITGTASGIGKATAEKLIAEGHIVYGGDIQFEKNKYLDELGGHSLDMDVTKVDMVNAGVQKVLDEQGRIDVLVNNAGFGQWGPVEEVSSEDAHYQMEVNLFGYANLIKAVLPSMRQSKSGTIVNVSSVGGRVYTPFGAWYHASKYAVEGLSDGLRFELMEFDIDVVLIEPGYIQTNFANVMFDRLDPYLPATKYTRLAAWAERTKEAIANPGPAAASFVANPSVVADAINQAIRAEIPETRYLVGPGANELVDFKAKYGDRAFDQMMLEGIGVSAAE